MRVVFLERPRIEDHQLACRSARRFSSSRGDARRLVAVLDEFAEGFGRHVDAAEELAARGLPAGAAALEDCDVGVADRAQLASPPSRARPLAAVENDDRRALPRHQVGDDHLEPRERRGAGEERMAAVVHALLAHVEQRELRAAARARRGRLRKCTFFNHDRVNYRRPRLFPGGRTMALKATKAEVWVATIEDRAGGAAEKLEALARAGANLEMLLARRTGSQGQGVMFVTLVKGTKAVKAAQESRLRQARQHPLGAGSRAATSRDSARRSRGHSANAGVSFRGVSAVAMGKKFISYIACDSAEDAAKAIAR